MLSLQGIDYSRAELEQKCQQICNDPEVEPWEKDIFQFILDWLNPTDFISSKTSGSTSEPKLIKLKKEYMKASAFASIAALGLEEGMTAWLCLPADFIAGKMMLVRAMTGKLKLIYSKPLLKPHMVGVVDFSALVPLQVSELMQTDKGLSLLRSIKKLIIGGGPLQFSIEEKLKNFNTQIWHTYGMTETITHIALRRLSGKKAGRWYQAMKGVQLASTTEGCLIIDAPHIGVQELATNDLVSFNQSGGFRILGRIDNIINSGGLKIIPEDLEEQMKPSFAFDHFFGSLPDERLGQRLVLFIEDKDEVLLPQVIQIWQLLEKGLKSRYLPKEIIYLSQFIRTENGKLNRKLSMALALKS